jgi:hypothetical protein
MRPERDNIAAPDLPEGIVWVGERPQSMPNLTAAGPVLVHFLDFAQLNSIRTLPYLVEWDRRYREAGLTTIGVQAPRFPFGSDPSQVSTGLADLGITFPVAIDAERELWLSYGCEGWPSLFLWTNGGALSWFHFGEGEYLGTEMAIQEELRELDALRSLSEPMQPLRPSDGPGAKVMPPSEELFPGGSWETPWVAASNGESLAVTCEGEGRIAIEVDGATVPSLEVGGAALYKLTEHPRHESHSLVLRPSPDLRIWSISFAPAVP